MNKTYVKYSKLYFKDQESEALKKAVEKLGVDASKIVTNHTSTHWVFELPESEQIKDLVTKDEEVLDNELSVTFDEKSFYVEKKDEPNFANARKLAKEYFNTFEGNVKKVEETETYFKFQKVR